MRKTLLICGTFLLTAMLSNADTITVGTAGNSTLATPTSPSPSFGTIVNFSALTPTTTPTGSITTGGAAMSSPDGLLVLPYSTMYNTPNEIFDDSSNGSANLTVKLGSATNEIGVGVADSDGVSIKLQALGANGAVIGSVFTENLNTTNDVNGNSYFAISDTSYDIYGFSILQSLGNANYSGLAIDDVQVAAAPEPSIFALFGAGLALLGGLRLRRKA